MTTPLVSTASLFAPNPSMDLQRWKALDTAFLFYILVIFSSAPLAMFIKLGINPPGGLGGMKLLDCCLCLAVAAAQPKKTLRSALIGLPFFVTSLWICMTFFWSSSPGDTLRSSLFLFVAHVTGCAIASRFTWSEFLRTLALCMTTLLFVSTLLAIAVPSIGQMQTEQPGTWCGLWPHKQVMGLQSALGTIACTTLIIKHGGRTMWWFGLAICLIAMLGTTGKTPILMCFVGISFMIWIMIVHMGLLQGMLTTYFAGAVAAAVVLSGSLSSEFLFKLMGRGSNLTGRTEIWQGVKYVAEMRPMTGWGYRAVWGMKDDLTAPVHWIFQMADFEPADSHSAWLDAFLEAGLPGLAMLTFCMIWAWLALLARIPRKNIGVVFCGGFLAASTLASFTESNLLNSFDLPWLLVVVCAVKLTSDTSPAYETGQR